MQLPLQLADIRAELERVRHEFGHLTAELSDADLWQKPADEGWSVGECLAHLNQVNEPYLTKMRKSILKARTKRRSGVGPFKLGVLGGGFVRQTSEAKGKVGTSKMFEPKREPDVVAHFIRVQAALLAVADDAEGLNLTSVSFWTPNLPLRLSLFEALNLVTVHEGRHLAQATRVRDQSGAR